MQKKLMTMAVAGALGALSTAALGQAGSSVQIYGTFSTSLEGAQAKGADAQALNPTTPGTFSSWRNPNNGAANAAAVFSTGVGGIYSGTPVNRDSRTRVASSGSNLGFRGREDLGSGMYAGFQAEIAVTLGGNTGQTSGTGATVATWRNSGLWIGGNSWGEIGWGMWDTPFNINMGLSPAHAPYSNASTTMVAGILGVLPGGGTISGYTLDALCNPNFITNPAAPAGATVAVPNITFGSSAATCFNAGASFHRRVSNSFWYQSPSWAGFRIRAQFGAEGNQTSSNTGAPASGGVAPSGVGGKLDPWLASVGASYTLGGLYAGVGYEYHKDYLATAARLYGGLRLGGMTPVVAGGLVTGSMSNIPSGFTGVNHSNDHAWNVNVRYTFGFGLSLGAYAEWLNYSLKYNGLDTTAGVATGGELQKLKKTGYRLDAAYQLGAHTFGIQYGWTPNITGNNFVTAYNGQNTKATDLILGYAYSLSKRTSLFGYATIVNNNSNANYSGIVFYGVQPAAGADPRYYGFGMRHTF